MRGALLRLCLLMSARLRISLRTMSALGQKQTSERQLSSSALCQKQTCRLDAPGIYVVSPAPFCVAPFKKPLVIVFGVPLWRRSTFLL